MIDIRTLFTRLLLALFMAGGILAASITAPSRADITFVTCPSGNSAIATTVTSCPFADEVRYSYFTQGGPSITAFSPVTGRSYRMYCGSGYTATMNTGLQHVAVRCDGGTNATVVFW